MFTKPTLTKHDFYYTDDALAKENGVHIAFATRRGGVSCAPYDTLNLGSHVGDDNDDVCKNRQILLDAMGKHELIQLYNPTQVHGDNVLEITDEHNVPATAKADGVICRCKNVAPLLCYADCTPVILVSENGDFAVVHCGWRGVVNKIAVKAFKLLEGEVNCYIGPHIRQCCFEVGPEVALQFSWDSIKEEFGEKPHVSMVDELKSQLVSAGLDESRFCDLGLCTKCHEDEFFSYRASGGKCGRHGAIAFRE